MTASIPVVTSSAQVQAPDGEKVGKAGEQAIAQCRRQAQPKGWEPLVKYRDKPL